MRILRTGDRDFREQFAAVVNRGKENQGEVEALVRDVLEGVRTRGDGALVEYAKRFDDVDLSPSQLRVPQEEIEKAYEKLPKEDLEALKLAAERIASFHRRQLVW
jgi:histidinol dehydrogenase